MEELAELERRVPTVSDKALITLVNGIQINRDIIRYQKERGFLGSLFDKIAGTDRGRRILLDGNLVAGQQALCDWVMELTDSLRVSQIALEITQESLLEARRAIRQQKDSLSIQKQDLATLDERLDKLTHNIENRLLNLEDRIHRLELNVAAQKDFELIVTSWEAKLTYTDLPWIIQVFMLVREVFSSAVALYELHTKDTTSYRKQLINRILAANKLTHPKFFSLSELLDLAWQQAQSADDLKLSLSVLETHTLPHSRQQQMPLLFTMNKTLELADLAEEIRPAKPARCAIELCRSQVQAIDYTTTMYDLISQVVHETANDSLFLTAKYLK